MKRLIAILILLPGITFSQENKAPENKKKSEIIPIQAQYSDSFCIKNISFNKETDLYGKGEVLHVQFVLQNNTDDPMDLYVFVIATFEKKEKTCTSFELPVPEKERIRSFVPFPLNLENFQYPVTDAKGNRVKDASGNDRLIFVKFPKEPKQGVDPLTNRPYHLNEKLLIRTSHLSKYRTNYFFFNDVTILVFNQDGQPQYRQIFKLKGFRH